MNVNKSTIKSGLNPDDDAPELTEEWFARGKLYVGGKLIRRGRPLGSGTKELVSLRLDKQALATFKATGPGWQVRINETIMRSAKRLATKSG
jgi:uncharacterized protein (DUF4415 family)